MSTRATKNLDTILVALSLLSVGIFCITSIAGIFDTAWRLRLLFNLINVSFDIFLALEFTIRLITLRLKDTPKGSGRIADLALMALGAFIPLIFVSGPFLLGWMRSDFSAPAVRGYWTSAQPYASLGLLGYLRLLRLSRVFPLASCRSRYKRAIILALSSVVCLSLLGAAGMDSMLLPSYKKMLSANRAETVRRLESLGLNDCLLEARINPDILAISRDGIPIFSRVDGAAREIGDYDFYRHGSISVWFTLESVYRIRSTIQAIVSCIVISATALVSLVASRQEKRGTEKMIRVKKLVTLRDSPVGKEELEGILGKTL